MELFGVDDGTIDSDDEPLIKFARPSFTPESSHSAHSFFFGELYKEFAGEGSSSMESTKKPVLKNTKH